MTSSGVAAKPCGSSGHDNSGGGFALYAHTRGGFNGNKHGFHAVLIRYWAEMKVQVIELPREGSGEMQPVQGYTGTVRE